MPRRLREEAQLHQEPTTPNDSVSGCAVVDLFCGVGGLTHGFKLRGFDVIAGIDIDNSCRYAYEYNNGAKFVSRSVSTLTAEELSAFYPEGKIRVLVGCAPCQPFSKYNNEKPVEQDFELLSSFVALIEKVQPEIVSMENVPDLRSYPIFEEFVTRLEALEYKVSERDVYCPNFGIPQTRTRLVLLASKLGEIHLVDETHAPDNYVTVNDAIGDLPAIEAGSASIADPMHCSSALNAKNMERIRSSKPGSNWKEWPEELKLTCHKKDSGKSYGSVYGRMKPDAPAPTMTTQCNGLGNGRFGHPSQDRAISLREAAILQSFPATYSFVEPKRPVVIKALARQVGNAVPVLLGEAIARSIEIHLTTHHA